MRKIIYVLAIIVLFGFVISGCSSEKGSVNANAVAASSAEQSTVNVDKLEVYHFHGNSQCSSCIAVGNLAEETVNTYFAEELKSGKIVFGHINAQLPENVALANKYQVTGSSLWLGVYGKDGNFYKEENVNVWYKINNKADYMNYLKGIIEKRLAGDLSQ